MIVPKNWHVPYYNTLLLWVSNFYYRAATAIILLIAHVRQHEFSSDEDKYALEMVWP